MFTSFHLPHHFNPTCPSFLTMSLCYVITTSFHYAPLYIYICVYVYILVCKVWCSWWLCIVFHFFYILEVHLDVQIKKSNLQTKANNHSIIQNDISFLLLALHCVENLTQNSVNLCIEKVPNYIFITTTKAIIIININIFYGIILPWRDLF